MKAMRNSVGTLGSALNLEKQNNVLLTKASSSPFIQILSTLPFYLQALATNQPSFLLGKEIQTNLSDPSVLNPPDGERIYCSNWVPQVPTLPCLSSQEKTQGSCGLPAWEGRTPSFIMVACCLTEIFRASLGCQPTRQEQDCFSEEDLPLQSWMASLDLIFEFCILSWMLN